MTPAKTLIRPPDIDRALLLTKADELDNTVEQLSAMRDGLRHAAVCTAPGHMQCPKFRRLLGLAAAGVISADRKPELIKKRRAKRA